MGTHMGSFETISGMRETEDEATLKAIQDVFEEEAKKITDWISGRPKERPNNG